MWYESSWERRLANSSETTVKKGFLKVGVVWSKDIPLVPASRELSASWLPVITWGMSVSDVEQTRRVVLNLLNATTLQCSSSCVIFIATSNYNSTNLMTLNVNIQYASYLICDPQRDFDPQVEKRWIRFFCPRGPNLRFLFLWMAMSGF